MNKYSKLIVVAIIFLVTIFTTAVLYVFLRTGSEPAITVAAFFAFATGELWALATIKKNKEKNKNRSNKNANNDRADS